MAIQCPAQSEAKTEVLAADWEGTVWTRSPTTRDQFPFYYLPKNREFINKLNKLYPTYILECCCQARRGWIGTANFAEGRTSVLKGVWEMKQFEHRKPSHIFYFKCMNIWVSVFSRNNTYTEN